VAGGVEGRGTGEDAAVVPDDQGAFLPLVTVDDSGRVACPSSVFRSARPPSTDMPTMWKACAPRKRFFRPFTGFVRTAGGALGEWARSEHLAVFPFRHRLDSELKSAERCFTELRPRALGASVFCGLLGRELCGSADENVVATEARLRIPL
jgi:hypothetical protein